MNTLTSTDFPVTCNPFVARPISLAVSLAVSTIMAFAQPVSVQADEEGEFSEVHLFFELNNTDGDLGIHALIDGDAWRRLTIHDKRERRILDVNVGGRLKRQGLTEIFFESAEPTFDELSPKKFFRRFPEGEYEIEAQTLEGEELEAEIELSHVMPAPPQTYVNGEAQADECDDEEPGFNPPEVESPVVISWDEVTLSHPEAGGGGAGVQPPVDILVYNYEVVVEAEFVIDDDDDDDDDEEEEFTTVFSIILPPDIYAVTIPEEFLAQAEEWKYEVLVREENYNQTATESCFLIAEE